MADYDTLSELNKIVDSIRKDNTSNNDNVKDVLLFLGGIAVGFGIKMALDSETFKSAANNAKVMMKGYLDNSIEYQEPVDDDVEVYIMNKDGE